MALKAQLLEFIPQPPENDFIPQKSTGLRQQNVA
jgi:hypothetical protein